MRAITMVIGALALAGCATTDSGLSRSTGSYASKLALSRDAKAVLMDAAAGLTDSAPNDAVLIYLAQRSPEDVRQQAVARATARALMMNSDSLCEQYMADFILKSRTTTSILGVSSIALSGAAGVTTPVRSANLLAALSAFTSSAQDKLSKTVLGEKTPELLYKAVMAERSQERSRLLALLQSGALGESSPGVVLAQLADYHGRCGPTVGINSLTNSVQGAADRAAKNGTDQADAFVNGLK